MPVIAFPDRQYLITDAQMLKATRVLAAIFAADKAPLAAFDPYFADPFEADFNNLIKAAIEQPPDTLVRSRLSTASHAVDEAEAHAVTHYEDVLYFARKAWPANRQRWGLFGYGGLSGARKTQGNLLLFMLTLQEATQTYLAALQAQGYTAAQWAALQAAVEALATANVAQEVKKRDQPLATRHRIEAYNAVWREARRLARAGKLVFADNYAKYQHYLLPYGEEEKSAFSITGTVKSPNGQPREGVKVTIASVNIETTTDEAGRFGIARLPAGRYPLRLAKPGLPAKSVEVEVRAGRRTKVEVVL